MISEDLPGFAAVLGHDVQARPQCGHHWLGVPSPPLDPHCLLPLFFLYFVFNLRQGLTM